MGGHSGSGAARAELVKLPGGLPGQLAKCVRLDAGRGTRVHEGEQWDRRRRR